MACAQEFKAALFTVYVVSIISALANPAELNYEEAYRLTQGANIVTLLLLAYCKRSVGDAFLAAALGLAYTLRATGSWEGGSRWDSLLVTVGMLFILQDAFYQVVPRALPHRGVVYLCFSCLIMPVLAALPYLVQKPQVDRGVIQGALDLSNAAYSPREQRARDHVTIYDKRTDTDAGIKRIGDVVYIYFRGSESLQDWKTNVDILGDTVPSDWACDATSTLRTHQGYTRAFQAVAAQVMDDLQAELARAPTSRIVTCGHSMGGALATMAGLFVTCKMPALRPNVAVVTFGSPQVGDSNFVAFFNDRVPVSVRVVNPMDPVPRLLSAQLVHVKGYYPVGTFSLKSLFSAHLAGTYAEAVSMPRAEGMVASVMPAVLAAGAIALYAGWQLHRT